MKFKKNGYLKSLFTLLAFLFFAQSFGGVMKWINHKSEHFHYFFQSPLTLVKNSKSDQIHYMAMGASGDQSLQLIFWADQNFDKQKPLEAMPQLVMKMAALNQISVPNNRMVEQFGQRAIITDGTYKRENGQLRNFLMINFRRDKFWWAFLATYTAGDQKAEEVANRVIRSLRILN
jgi:hypothetical protein